MSLTKNAILIIKGLPNGTEFGVDMQSYAVGDRFLGVKYIPAGPHFIYWSSRDQNGDLAIRIGFLKYFVDTDLFVYEWEPEKEELKPKVITGGEKIIVRNYVKEVAEYLLNYDYEFYEKWCNLTSKLTSSVISRLNPKSGFIRPYAELFSDPTFDRSSYNSNDLKKQNKRLNLDFLQDDDIELPFLLPATETIPNFTAVPDRCPKTSQASEITKHHMDCLDAIELLFRNFDSNYENLIAEIQYSFVAFIICYSIEGLMQWRRILLLMSNSHQAAQKYPEFYNLYFNILKYQVCELPQELLQLTHRNLVYRDIKQLVVNAHDNSRLTEGVLEFRSIVQRQLKWFLESDLYDEDPEDLPVIVET